MKPACLCLLIFLAGCTSPTQPSDNEPEPTSGAIGEPAGPDEAIVSGLKLKLEADADGDAVGLVLNSSYDSGETVYFEMLADLTGLTLLSVLGFTHDADGYHPVAERTFRAGQSHWVGLPEHGGAATPFPVEWDAPVLSTQASVDGKVRIIVLAAADTETSVEIGLWPITEARFHGGTFSTPISALQNTSMFRDADAAGHAPLASWERFVESWSWTGTGPLSTTRQSTIGWEIDVDADDTHLAPVVARTLHLRLNLEQKSGWYFYFVRATFHDAVVSQGLLQANIADIQAAYEFAPTGNTDQCGGYCSFEDGFFEFNATGTGDGPIDVQLSLQRHGVIAEPMLMAFAAGISIGAPLDQVFGELSTG